MPVPDGRAEMKKLASTRRLFSTLTESAFMKLWTEEAHRIATYCEDTFAGRSSLESVDIEDQYVKVVVDDTKVFVISRQVPKREIWYSSPISGPSHFCLKEKSTSWVNAEGQELFSLLQDDLDKAVKTLPGI